MNKRVLAQLARRELARRRYADYLALTGGPGWRRTRMSEYLAQTVQRFLETPTGHAYDILLVETPPQHGKSMAVTEALPSWYLGRWPGRRVIVAGYNDKFAERFCRRNRDKLQTAGPLLWGDAARLEVCRATELELANGRGRLISRGMMAGITGNPADLLIVDDPVKNREEADSPTRRARLWEEWQNSLKSRFAAGARVVVIMTPWHEDDLAGRILRCEQNVTLLRLPCEAEPGDALGRATGEPLCPELGKDAAWLEDFKKGYLSDPRGGARAWAALYQCSPRTEGGNLVRRDWWRYFNPAAPPPLSEQIISLDAAFKDGDRNDFVALTVWGRAGNDFYLLWCLNRRLDFPGTLDAVRTAKNLWPGASRALVEDKANGSAVIQMLRREMFCIPVDPRGGKVARVNAVSPAIESGHVFLPEGQGWVEDYLDQWSAFPAGKHDDMVDSSTQALSYFLQSPGGRTQLDRVDAGVTAFLDGGAAYDVYEAPGPAGRPIFNF